MTDATAHRQILTKAHSWSAVPDAYHCLIFLRFTDGGTGVFTYGHGQMIYAVINCHWQIQRAGLLTVEYLESPPYQLFEGFTPAEKNRSKEIGYQFAQVNHIFEMRENVGTSWWIRRWSLALDRSPYPDGIDYPYEFPWTFYSSPERLTPEP